MSNKKKCQIEPTNIKWYTDGTMTDEGSVAGGLGPGTGFSRYWKIQ